MSNSPCKSGKSGKHALLIGIDKYPCLTPSADLRGAVNDVKALKGFLRQQLAFNSADMQCLLDGAATRRGILDGFEELNRRVEKNDLVIVHFSGHGSFRPNPDNPDGTGQDETLVPFDSGRDALSPDLDITCHEIRQRLLPITQKTRRLTVIFDCCHAGTMVRDPRALRVRGLPPHPSLPTASSPPPKRSPSWWPYDQSYAFFAACRNHEKARELEGGKALTDHGALTFFLVEELHRVKPDATCRDVFEGVALAMRGRFTSQHPQLEGAGDRLFFGEHELKPHRFLALRQRADQTVVLAGGAAHRVEAGSRWEAYPAGTKDPNAAAALGEMEITDVGAVESQARLVVETHEDAVSIGGRAILRAPSDRIRPLGVRILSDHGFEAVQQSLMREVTGSPFLTLQEEEVPALTVYLLRRRQEIEAESLLPDLGRLEDDCYAVTNPEGELAMPVRALSGPISRLNLLQNMEDRYRWLETLNLRPLGPDSLQNRIAFDLLNADGDLAPISTSGVATFDEGEFFALRVHNGTPRPLHVYVLYLSFDGEVDLLYPPQGAYQPVEPGHPLTLGLEGDRFSFELHRDLPYDLKPGPFEVEETLKVIATSEATDLYPLFQGSYRRPEDFPHSELGRLLMKALMAHAMRHGSNIPQPSEPACWTTFHRTVRIRGRARYVNQESPP